MNAIEIEALSKRYRLGLGVEAQSLRDAIALRGPGKPKPASEDIWALRDLSMSVARGEALGVIGRNGAGKSTLLKILARVTRPTKGVARTRGRVGALLEVGTGMHPELTGRENVFLNGVLLGISRGDVRRRFDEIVSFAGVERFIDTPLKRYSSGMQLRLAFAVAAHLEPEIVIVDEVLAVGDEEFRQRCMGTMAGLGKEGRTVVFVSHDLGSITTLCGRAIWLDAGRVRQDGKPQSVIDSYRQATIPGVGEGTAEGSVENDQASVTYSVFGANASRASPAVQREVPIELHLRIQLRGNVRNLDVAVWIEDAGGARIIDDAWSDYSSDEPEIFGDGSRQLRVRIPGVLPAGDYVVGAWIGSRFDEIFDGALTRLAVVPQPGDRAEPVRRRRAIQPRCTWTSRTQ
jgi:ABC-2 type transport system ATP-binding protein/lipopolysaccharide transport system ATP-binding protein